MTTFQKVIKYLAIALAIFLIVSIISGIVGVIAFFSGASVDGVSDEIKSYEISQNITSLKIDINAADLTVTEGESFSVKSNLKYLTVEEKNGTLILTEKKKFGASYTNAKLELCIPEGTVFEKADIITGAGRFTVDTLSAKHLALELGAGQVTIDRLNASHNAEIDGGAGELTIKGGSLQSLELDMGVGRLSLTAQLLGSSDIDLGVGESNITLIGTKSDYEIELDKGLGNASIDGASMSDGDVWGEGANKIRVSGGVGAIKISLKETQ